MPLNQNLIAIIGGRGEGKSMLADFIASSFVDQSPSKEGDFRKDGNLTIEYLKTNQKDDEKLSFQLNKDKHAVEFIYINQGQLKNTVEKKDKQSSLANSIRRLAKLSEPRFNQGLNEQILQTLKRFHELSDFFAMQDEGGYFINNIEYLQKQESSINEFINNITTEENKGKLSRYSSNLSEINTIKAKREQLLIFENELKKTILNLNSDVTQKLI